MAWPRTLAPSDPVLSCCSASSLSSINQLWAPPECEPRTECWGRRPAHRERLRRGIEVVTTPGVEVKAGQRVEPA